jgi:hypothetical protein
VWKQCLESKHKTEWMQSNIFLTSFGQLANFAMLVSMSRQL